MDIFVIAISKLSFVYTKTKFTDNPNVSLSSHFTPTILEELNDSLGKSQ
jgi:hypothetical protein